MAEYQNIFTRVQAVAPAYAGIPLARGNKEREGPPAHVHLLGRFGDASCHGWRSSRRRRSTGWSCRRSTRAAGG